MKKSSSGVAIERRTNEVDALHPITTLLFEQCMSVCAQVACALHAYLRGKIPQTKQTTTKPSKPLPAH